MNSFISKMVQELLGEYQVNIIKCFFINSTLLVVFIWLLLNVREVHLLTVVRQSFLYGKLNIRGEQSPFVRKLEVPKSWFGHFYIFAAGWSLLALTLMLKGFLNAGSASDCLLDLLDFFAGGKGRKVLVDSTSGFLAMLLITMQLVRRCYETHFIQIFSSQSKINLWHYLLSFAHYFGVVVALLANTEGFVRGKFWVPSPYTYTYEYFTF